ncbi:cytochrome c peroxidase [Flavobacterium cerinum]|uniref:Cytochrome-c peroxidase n=1 Tax=Flavobacterium cerinum TaxID=2502784 RepID=A0ABY5IVP7_9FLAO|nr:cytochrome c peroxidase [Flavobacterium cerinum]UUC45409.1 cytochrome-c peroxidase [Flavobacterium cerinum]
MRLLLITFSCLLLFTSCQNKQPEKLNPVQKTHYFLKDNYIAFADEVKTLYDLTLQNTPVESLQKQFKKARLGYKNVESLVTFYYPEASKTINGAAIDKNDVHETSRKIEEATGFQKIEESLFTENPDRDELRKQTGILNGLVQSLRDDFALLELTDSNIFEAQKLQMLRMMSLGISGFDSPVAFHSLPEAITTLKSIHSVVSLFSDNTKLDTLIAKSTAYIEQHPDFNNFNRADFIVDYCIPISKAIHQIQFDLKIPNNPIPTAIDFSKATVFEEGAFNPDFFAPASNKKPSPGQIALGKQLFFDPLLSGNNKVSCATCHIPEAAYADHKTKAVNGSTLSRNTPTLLASAYQNVQFLDGRVAYLEDQAKNVINNKDEMHGSFAEALRKVQSNSAYQSAFKKVFKDNTVTEEALLKSLASFVRSLSKMDSKFDAYLRGKNQLTVREKNGFNLFMGKAKCATCHFFPLFNGSVPPFYNETESEVLGVPSRPVIQNAIIDSDLGEYLITKAPLKKYAFKTPTVRNSAITYPYMHNGVYQSLEAVIDFYNRGGGAGIGISVDNQTLPPDELGLNQTEISDLILFIKTLDSPKTTLY